MKKELTLDEFRAFIVRFLKNGNRMTIQQRISPSDNSLGFIFNIPVTSCLSIFKGIQFKLDGRGYIDLLLTDGNSRSLKETTLNLEFIFDKDFNGHSLHIGDATLIFYGDNLTDLLNNIEKETRQYHKEEQDKQREMRLANGSLPEEAWESIDNMIEK